MLLQQLPALPEGIVATTLQLLMFVLLIWDLICGRWGSSEERWVGALIPHSTYSTTIYPMKKNLAM